MNWMKKVKPLRSKRQFASNGLNFSSDHRDELDEKFKPLLENWRFERIGTSTKLILRFATWELEHGDTDPRIVINEAVELGKAFAEKDAYKFINGVLDRIVKSRSA